MTSLLAGSRARRDALRHHLRVAEDRRATLQRAAGGADERRREGNVVGDVDHAAGMDHAHGDVAPPRR